MLPMMNRWLGQVVLVSCMLIARATAGDEPQVQSFENLFRELQESAEERRPIGLAEASESLAATVDRIVRTRNEIVSRNGGLFRAINDTVRAEMECMQAFRVLAMANGRVQQARAVYNREVQQSAILGKSTLALDGARQNVDLAEDVERRAAAEFREKRERLDRFYGFLRRDIPDFLRCYDEFRRIVPHERGAVNAELIDRIEQHDRQSPEWVEGAIVAAMLSVYDGDDAQAESHLERAATLLKACPPLLRSMLAEDGCSAWLLLGRPDKVSNYIAMIKRIPANRRSAMEEWLIGADARVRGRHADAVKQLTAALNKAKKKATPALIAEAALAQLLADPNGRRFAKAEELLDEVKDNETWPVLQSRAALAGAESRWGDAVHLVELCRAKAPPCLDSELDAQKTSYENEKVWRP